MPLISNFVGLRLLNRENHFNAVCVSRLISSSFLSSKYTLNRAALFFFLTGVTSNFSFFFSSFSFASSSSEITDNLNCTKFVSLLVHKNALMPSTSAFDGLRPFLILNESIALHKFFRSVSLSKLLKYTAYASYFPFFDFDALVSIFKL